MNPVATTTGMSDEQIIAQYVECLHEEYTKTEVEQTFGTTHWLNNRSPDHSSTQIVAPWDGESSPTGADFIRVSCRQLNSSGISFLVSERPTVPLFIIVVETRNETAFVKARVVQVEPDTEVGSTSYLVQAMFVGQVDPSILPSLATTR